MGLEMKILQVMAGASGGGAEGFFEGLTGAMAEAGVDQWVAIRRDAGREARLRARTVRVESYPFGGTVDFQTPVRLAHLIRRERPDLVLTWMNRATAAVSRALHTPVLGVPQKERPVHLARLGGYYKMKYYQQCDYLIGDTPDIVAYLIREGWPEDRTKYLPNFPPHLGQANRLTKMDHQTPEDMPVILALGRLHPNKGLDTLLRAVPQLGRAHIWIAGDGPLDTDLKSLAADLGITDRVRFLGWRRDVEALLATADLVAFPSRHEPLGNVVLEAWAHGTPIVATASDGPAFLIKDGVSGRLVPVDDVEAFAQALNDVLGSQPLRDTLIAGGRESFETGYSKEIVVDLYRDYFSEVLARSTQVKG